jgi:hypothetical protein
MTLADLVQLGVVLFGSVAVWLHGCRDARVKRWGIMASLVCEPLWLYGAVKAGLWGIVIMCGIFTAGWLRGLYNHFWLPYRDARRIANPPEPPPCPDDTPCNRCPHVVACTAYINAGMPQHTLCSCAATNASECLCGAWK